MTQPTPSDPFTCPVCDSCDHDIRGTVLEFVANVRENLTGAADSLIDAMETEGPASAEFAEALIDLATVRRQIDSLILFVPDVALIKAANS